MQVQLSVQPLGVQVLPACRSHRKRKGVGKGLVQERQPYCYLRDSHFLSDSLGPYLLSQPLVHGNYLKKYCIYGWDLVSDSELLATISTESICLELLSEGLWHDSVVEQVPKSIQQGLGMVLREEPLLSLCQDRLLFKSPGQP